MQAGLRAAISNRQWVQDRCWTAGFTQHDRCRLCVVNNSMQRADLASSGHEGMGPQPPAVDDVSGEDINSAPVALCNTGCATALRCRN